MRTKRRSLIWRGWHPVRSQPHTSILERVEIPSTDPAHRGVYMRRWTLARFERYGSVRFHHLMQPDFDRDPHDHPWWFLVIRLRGGYVERWGRAGEHQVPKRRTVRWASFHRSTDLHRIDHFLNGRDSWSLFVTGPMRRRWGFNQDGVWIDSEVYIEERDREFYRREMD